MCSVAVVLPSNENDVFQYPNVTMTMVEELVRIGELDVLENVFLDNRYVGGESEAEDEKEGRMGVWEEGSKGGGGREGKGEGGG